MNIVILASGTGSNARAIMQKARDGLLNVDVRAVISNKQDAGALKLAKEMDVPAIHVDPKNFASRAEYDMALLERIREREAECVVLAGYMLLLSRRFLENFGGYLINIHPSLLPSFPGTHGAADALAYGVKITGVTVHFVNEEMDMGPIIIQAALPVISGQPLNELLQRIHAIEHRIYPQALQWLAEGRIAAHNRQVMIQPGGKPAAQPPDAFIWPPLEEGF